MSIYGNPVALGGGGGGTIISKTITENGTYNALSDSADGYNPVIVSIPTDIENWDFKTSTPYVGKIRGWNLTYSGTIIDQDGVVFDAGGDYLKLPSLANITIEVDVVAMNLTSGSHRRFIMGTDSNGFIYRSTGVWAFYNGSWQDSSETDGSFFSGSTVKVVVDSSNKWHIYKNDVLWWEPTGAQALSSPYIGSTSYSLTSAKISALKIR